MNWKLGTARLDGGAGHRKMAGGRELDWTRSGRKDWTRSGREELAAGAELVGYAQVQAVGVYEDVGAEIVRIAVIISDVESKVVA
jgi:hypothetical protein